MRWLHLKKFLITSQLNRIIKENFKCWSILYKDLLKTITVSPYQLRYYPLPPNKKKIACHPPLGAFKTSSINIPCNTLKYQVLVTFCEHKAFKSWFLQQIFSFKISIFSLFANLVLRLPCDKVSPTLSAERQGIYLFFSAKQKFFDNFYWF